MSTTKYHVTRQVTVIQSAVLAGTSESDAVEKSRKLPWKTWKTVDRKRRKAYKATKVEYSR